MTMSSLDAELGPTSVGRVVLPAECYHSHSVFKAETKAIFNSKFQFACLTSEVEKDRDFVCIDHAGAAVVVQNFKGVIKAFQNICTHRFNRIQSEEQGNRPLTCMYHGWTFDASGFPSGMPKKEQFLTGRNREDFCLPEYRVEICGKFAFVVDQDETLTLRDYLGEFFLVLEEVSKHIGQQVYRDNILHAANWKLLVENVVECYHCSTVHRDTFIPQGFGKAPLQDLVIDREHSSSHFPRTAAAQEDLRRRYLAHLKNREFSHDSYYHIFIFPNLFVSSSEGMTFYVGHALPLSSDQTSLRIRYYEPNLQLVGRHRVRQDEVTEQSNAIGLALIEEDRVILEAIQRNMSLTRRPGALGDEEVRIKAFWDAYASRMTNPALAES
jgi:phenylpropionate dioxygenase-like ring-hydroxylating dioxygenase large terminal subunit